MVVVSPFVVGTNDELERSAIVGTRLTNSRPAPIGCASEQLAPCIHKNSIAALILILGLCPQPPRTTTI